MDHLQKENSQLQRAIRCMAEELKELQCRSSDTERRQTADKSTETERAIDDKTFRSMMEDIEQELESAYHHIQILEEQSVTPDDEDKERSYLREKVVSPLYCQTGRSADRCGYCEERIEECERGSYRIAHRLKERT